MSLWYICYMGRGDMGIHYVNAYEMYACENTSFSGVHGLSFPTYISPWVYMNSNDISSTYVTFEHGFDTRPAKADVQV